MICKIGILFEHRRHSILRPTVGQLLGRRLARDTKPALKRHIATFLPNSVARITARGWNSEASKSGSSPSMVYADDGWAAIAAQAGAAEQPGLSAGFMAEPSHGDQAHYHEG